MKNKENNNKELGYIILILSILIIGIGSIIFMDFFMNNDKNIYTDNKIVDNRKIADNVENNLEENKLDLNLEDWKKEQIKNYKYATDLKFGSGNIVNIDLEAREVELELIKGVKTKMNTYNTGSSIKPLIIRAKKGDKIVVNFKNSLSQETTVHWHGVRVPNSQDGVPGVTQEPIPVGGKYNYTFVVNDPGTFIFHPHKNHSEQIGRGLYGVLIVEDDNEIKYDKEFTWVLKDYRVNRNGELTDDFGNLHDAVHGGRLGNILTINNEINKTVEVNPGDTIRLRLANMSNARIYNLDLSKFNAKIIATDDGIINNPKRIYSLEIAPGERYGLEIKIGLEKKDLILVDHYYNTNSLATIKVVGKKIAKEEIKTPVGDLPDWRNVKYNKPDIIIDLGGMGVMGGDKGMGGMMGGGERGWTINDGIFPKTNKPIKLKKGKMYIIRMVNNTSRDHPMHLHGDFFQVINVSGMKGEYIGWKDTVNVKGRSYIDVAFIPTNAGSWAFHCHILEHADLGMFTTMDVEE